MKELFIQYVAYKNKEINLAEMYSVLQKHKSISEETVNKYYVKIFIKQRKDLKIEDKQIIIKALYDIYKMNEVSPISINALILTLHDKKIIVDYEETKKILEYFHNNGKIALHNLRTIIDRNNNENFKNIVIFMANVQFNVEHASLLCTYIEKELLNKNDINLLQEDLKNFKISPSQITSFLYKIKQNKLVLKSLPYIYKEKILSLYVMENIKGILYSDLFSYSEIIQQIVDIMTKGKIYHLPKEMSEQLDAIQIANMLLEE